MELSYGCNLVMLIVLMYDLQNKRKGCHDLIVHRLPSFTCRKNIIARFISAYRLDMRLGASNYLRSFWGFHFNWYFTKLFNGLFTLHWKSNEAWQHWICSNWADADQRDERMCLVSKNTNMMLSYRNKCWIISLAFFSCVWGILTMFKVRNRSQ